MLISIAVSHKSSTNSTILAKGRLTAKDRALRWLKPLEDESRDLGMCMAGDDRPEDGPEDGVELVPIAWPLYSALE